MNKIALLLLTLLILSCSSQDYRSEVDNVLPDRSTFTVNTIAAISDTGEDFFSSIRGMTITSDGELLLLDRGTQAFLLFDVDGSYKGKVGNEGRGPGEFVDIRYFLVTPDDVLHVFDRNNSRHQIFVKENGEWGQQTEIELRQLQSENMHSFYPQKIVDIDENDERKKYLALFRNNIGFRDTTTVYHEWLTWVDDQMKPKGDEMLFLDYAETAVTMRTENSVTVYTHPAGYKRFLEYDENNSLVHFANGATGEITVQDLDKNIIRSIQLPVEIVPIDSNDKSNYLNNIRRWHGQQASNRANELYLDHEPVIKQFVFADDGTYWIETARLDPESPNWIVIDESGKIIASFHTDDIFEEVQTYRLYAVEGNKMYGSGSIDELPHLIISELTDVSD